MAVLSARWQLTPAEAGGDSFNPIFVSRFAQHCRRAARSNAFLSYSNPDSAKAQLIAKRLAAANFSVWWDGELSGGDSLPLNMTMLTPASAQPYYLPWLGRSLRKRPKPPLTAAVFREARRAGKLPLLCRSPCEPKPFPRRCWESWCTRLPNL
jgi:hypothetical protein